MKSLTYKLLALALISAFSAGAFAQTMSKADFKVQEEKIESDAKAAKAACASFSGQAKSVCVVDAKGRASVAKAELEANYKPTVDTRYTARVAIADAAYDLAREHCNEKTSNAKDVCVKEAKAAHVAGKADAKVQLKTTEANTTANEKKTDAKNTAADDKNTALYKVANEKCDSFAGAAKTTCHDQAKMTYGK
jgi:hypothetical protein